MLSWRCPVSDDLDMIGIARQYVQLELPAFALACLMLMPHSEKRHQQIKVPCKQFLGGWQRNGRSRIACALQKVAFSFHQTWKTSVWVGWKICVEVGWKNRLIRAIWQRVWRGLNLILYQNSWFSWKTKLKWSGSISERIIHVGCIRGERRQEGKPLGSSC